MAAKQNQKEVNIRSRDNKKIKIIKTSEKLINSKIVINSQKIVGLIP